MKRVDFLADGALAFVSLHNDCWQYSLPDDYALEVMLDDRFGFPCGLNAAAIDVKSAATELVYGNQVVADKENSRTMLTGFFDFLQAARLKPRVGNRQDFVQ